MEYLEKRDGKIYRKYSNETMRRLKRYIDRKGLKGKEQDYEDVIYRLYLKVNDKRLRTKEEKIEDLKEII